MNKLNVCFVCNGNNSRSVIAEFIAKNKWKDTVEITSCGINANEGSEISYHTQRVLAELGISIGEKRRTKSLKTMFKIMCFISPWMTQ